MAGAFDLSWDEIERLAVNALRASFAPYEVRTRIEHEVVRPRTEVLVSRPAGR